MVLVEQTDHYMLFLCPYLLYFPQPTRTIRHQPLGEAYQQSIITTHKDPTLPTKTPPHPAIHLYNNLTELFADDYYMTDSIGHHLFAIQRVKLKQSKNAQKSLFSLLQALHFEASYLLRAVCLNGRENDGNCSCFQWDYNSFVLGMRFKERDQSSLRCYQRISLGKRKRLVQLVEVQGQPLSKVVKKLKIKLTTARLIITKYRETGEFPMRDFKKRAIKQRIQTSLAHPLSEYGHEEEKLQQPEVTPFPAHVLFPEQGLTYQYVHISPMGVCFFPCVYN